MTTLMILITTIAFAATGFVAGCAWCARSERRQIRDLLNQLDEHAAEYWRQEDAK